MEKKRLAEEKARKEAEEAKKLEPRPPNEVVNLIERKRDNSKQP
jgi:hypothetical protein